MELRPTGKAGPACAPNDFPPNRFRCVESYDVDGMARARFLVAYDGSGFHGFASNPGVSTVLGSFSQALSTVARVPVQLVGAGRTDAGVHAWGQVISGDVPGELDLADVSRRLNKLLAPGIAVRRAEWTDDDFHARFSATSRQYRYHVWNAPYPNPLWAGRCWHVPKPLKRWTLQAACDPLIGEHDFSSFCRRAKVADADDQRSNIRRVLDARWVEVDTDLLRFEISATAFCHQMVRSIVGTTVDVGAGRISAGDMRSILLARDRAMAGTVAPPHGLTLWHVDYPQSTWP